MTLSTHVYLLTEADPEDVFVECRRLLGATDPDVHPFVNDLKGTRGEGSAILRNQAGVGLAALLWMHYRADGTMLRPADVCDEDCDEDCSGEWHDPPHWIDIDFDTAYSYRDERGFGCGALHARLLFELGGWLDERGVRWAWRDEFSGEIHVGDKYEHLKDLIGDGQSAVQWFKGTVEPFIASLGVVR